MNLKFVVVKIGLWDAYGCDKAMVQPHFKWNSDNPFDPMVYLRRWL